MKNRKTPQQKKRESYLRDRRNTYGENDKSSRRNIPLRKRLRSRCERRLARTAFVTGDPALDLERVDEVESRLVLKRRKGWTKSPDAPLAQALERSIDRRVAAGILDADAAEATRARIREMTRRDR